MLRVMVVDDSALYRKVLADALRSIPDVEVVATASNGIIALGKIDTYKPDLLTLDLEMPELDGLGLLRKLQNHSNPPSAIMISASTSTGAENTTEALRLGAFDFVLKPNGTKLAENVTEIQGKLAEKIDAFRCTRRIDAPVANSPPAQQKVLAQYDDAKSQSLAKEPRSRQRPEVIAIGISTGGPQALTQVLPKLPADLPVPILIVQHMPPIFTKSLANDLNRRCDVSVCEGEMGQSLEPGHVYIAPGGRQMKVQRHEEGERIVITNDPAENSCRPAVDYLFRSVADVYGNASLGIIMTGMGYDGAFGCQLMKRRGASIMAQDEASCVVYGMPRKPVEQGIANIVAPLDQIADQIIRSVTVGVSI